jgi:transcriptional regulator with XRE-family HTH domain
METKKLGSRIRALRERQALLRADLAERAGLAEDFIAALEEEDLYPSLGPLLKVSRALGVRLGTFMDDVSSADPLIVRLCERSEELSMHGEDKHLSLRFHSLGRGKSDRHMEPFYIEILPEENAEPKLSSHEGEEFIVVLSGRVALVHGRDRHELAPGDSVYFNSIVPHEVSAAGNAPAEIYAVLYFPE